MRSGARPPCNQSHSFLPCLSPSFDFPSSKRKRSRIRQYPSARPRKTGYDKRNRCPDTNATESKNGRFCFATWPSHLPQSQKSPQRMLMLPLRSLLSLLLAAFPLFLRVSSDNLLFPHALSRFRRFLAIKINPWFATPPLRSRFRRLKDDKTVYSFLPFLCFFEPNTWWDRW